MRNNTTASSPYHEMEGGDKTYDECDLQVGMGRVLRGKSRSVSHMTR